MENTKTQIIDKMGILTSGLCAVHCMVFPLMLSFGLLNGLANNWHGITEIVVILCSIILGSWSVINALRSHGKRLPQYLIIAGAIMVIIGFAKVEANHLIMAIGGMILLSGHWMNWQKIISTP